MCGLLEPGVSPPPAGRHGASGERTAGCAGMCRGSRCGRSGSTNRDCGWIRKAACRCTAKQNLNKENTALPEGGGSPSQSVGNEMSNFVQLAVQGTNTEDCQIAIAIASRASGKLTAGGGGRLACFAKQQAGERGGYAHLAFSPFSI